MDDEKDTIGRPEFDFETTAPPKKKKAKRPAKKKATKPKAKKKTAAKPKTVKRKPAVKKAAKRSAKKVVRRKTVKVPWVRLDFRVPEHLKTALDTKAQKTRRSITSVMVELLEHLGKVIK